ncbi:MAG TPA: LysM peptidoglycan-binding domain-containing protein [Chloroflexi bacterium]|nr:LysM peptidoglycan-binding domain-containing protein [Chloroflexota bacterium]
MQRKPLALILIIVLVAVAVLSSGCRRSAAPPIEELPSEEEVNAAIQEAQGNTEVGSSPVETPEPTGIAPPATPSSTPEPTALPPTPTATLVPVVIEPTTAPTEAPPAEPTTATPLPAGTTYVVQPGDNLFRIGLRYGVTVAQLARANNITNPALIYVGQVLTIPSPTSGTTGGTSPGGGACATVYVVKPGDNLFRIALRYGYSQYYLAQVNGIANPSLVYVGQQICIP